MKKAEKDAEQGRAKRARQVDQAARERRKLWGQLAGETANDAGWRLRARGLAPPSAAKIRRRLATGRVRPHQCTPREAWAIASRESARAGAQMCVGWGGGRVVGGGEGGDEWVAGERGGQQ